MIQLAKKPIFETLEKLPKNFTVLDVGGSSAPFKRANSIIDIQPFEDIYWAQAKGPGEILVTKDSYTQFDICSREKWPFADKQFDFSVCSHVLEDIRDPLWVCSEIMRVSKAGYIEIPSIHYETCFGVEAKNLAGNAHHRWFVDLFENKLRFTFKNFYVHSKVINKNKTKYTPGGDEMFLRLEWNDSFGYYENWIGGKEFFEFLLKKNLSQKDVWRIYRKVDPRNIIVRWLAYLKNTNTFFADLFKKSKGLLQSKTPQK